MNGELERTWKELAVAQFHTSIFDKSYLRSRNGRKPNAWSREDQRLPRGTEENASGQIWTWDRRNTKQDWAALFGLSGSKKSVVNWCNKVSSCKIWGFHEAEDEDGDSVSSKRRH
jgi:hypothetical protein